MHAHHSDHSVAAAIFANGTYFVDMPRNKPARKCKSLELKHPRTLYFLQSSAIVNLKHF
jgi:hypothetical protein